MKTFKKIKEFCDTDLGGLVLSTVVMILVTIFAFLPIDARAVCASPISRTNSSANSVLTSTKYNLDLNTLYTHVNNLPGDCIQDSTITFDKLDTSSFAALLNGIQQGCKVTYSNASTVLIDKCIASVNGEFIRTTTTTSASFGCANCSSETSSTLYYLYIKDGSTGTTITPLILTSAPNNDGYDASNNKVLARFYNNSSGDIDQYSIDQWHLNKFIPQDTGWINDGAIKITAATVNPSKGSVVNYDFQKWRRDGSEMIVEGVYNQESGSGGGNGSGIYYVRLPNAANIKVDTSHYPSFSTANMTTIPVIGEVALCNTSGTIYGGNVSLASASLVKFSGGNETITNWWGSSFFELTSGIRNSWKYSVRIEGWSD